MTNMNYVMSHVKAKEYVSSIGMEANVLHGRP